MSYHYVPLLGCDPEFFFAKNGKVIGSEKVIPEKGLGTQEVAKIVRDGVQVEINPRAETCRAFLMNNISSAFKAIHTVVKREGLTLEMGRRIRVDKEELLSLSPEAMRLGCAPSISHYDKGFDIAKIVKGRTIKSRSAGGHIHIGCNSGHAIREKPDYPEVRERANILVPLLDTIVGNTFVIWDTDPANAVRRKLYGRAGEHRLPDHGGLEYRTLSNFWLYHEALASLVFGMVRIAASLVIGDARAKTSHSQEILSAVDPKEIVKAINKNDPALALDNWEKVKKVLKRLYGNYFVNYTDFMYDEIDLIDFFLKKGQEFWWPSNKHDVLNHWLTMPEGHAVGWGTFCHMRVWPEYKKEMESVKANEPVS